MEVKELSRLVERWVTVKTLHNSTCFIRMLYFHFLVGSVARKRLFPSHVSIRSSRCFILQYVTNVTKISNCCILGFYLDIFFLTRCRPGFGAAAEQNI